MGKYGFALKKTPPGVSRAFNRRLFLSWLLLELVWVECATTLFIWEPTLKTYSIESNIWLIVGTTEPHGKASNKTKPLKCMILLAALTESGNVNKSNFINIY